MVSFVRLLEQVSRKDPFSPFFDTAKQMTEEEVDFLENHESNPSTANTETPPAQVEWQWESEDLVYNCHLVKEVYDNSRRGLDVGDTETPKRYKLMGFVYNNRNNLSGLVEDYTSVSKEFNQEARVDILESFLEDKDFLYENDTGERKVYTFSRPSDFEY